MEEVEILKSLGFHPSHIYQYKIFVGHFIYTIKNQSFVDTRTGENKKGLYTMIYLLKKEK